MKLLEKPPPKRKTVYSELCHVLRGEKCPDASRMFALKYRVRRDLNTDVSVYDWHARLRLAPRWRLAEAKGLRETAEMWGGRPREKYILWFVIVRASTIWNLMARHISMWLVRAISGSYEPLKDKMYWPGGLKSAPGQRASTYVEGWNYIKVSI